MRAEVSTIHSRSFGRYLAAGGYLRISLAGAAGPTQTSPSEAMISVMTWNSRSRKLSTGARRKSPSTNRRFARFARARARKQVRASGAVQVAAGVGKLSIRVVFSASPRPARIAREKGAGCGGRLVRNGDD